MFFGNYSLTLQVRAVIIIFTVKIHRNTELFWKDSLILNDLNFFFSAKNSAFEKKKIKSRNKNNFPFSDKAVLNANRVSMLNAFYKGTNH